MSRSQVGAANRRNFVRANRSRPRTRSDDVRCLCSREVSGRKPTGLRCTGTSIFGTSVESFVSKSRSRRIRFITFHTPRFLPIFSETRLLFVRRVSQRVAAVLRRRTGQRRRETVRAKLRYERSRFSLSGIHDRQFHRHADLSVARGGHRRSRR